MGAVEALDRPGPLAGRKRNRWWRVALRPDRHGSLRQPVDVDHHHQHLAAGQPQPVHDALHALDGRADLGRILPFQPRPEILGVLIPDAGLGRDLAYLASNAAVPLVAAFLGDLPGEEHADILRWVSYGVFSVAFLPLIFGGKVYNTVEKVMVTRSRLPRLRVPALGELGYVGGRVHRISQGRLDAGAGD